MLSVFFTPRAHTSFHVCYNPLPPVRCWRSLWHQSSPTSARWSCWLRRTSPLSCSSTSPPSCRGDTPPSLPTSQSSTPSRGELSHTLLYCIIYDYCTLFMCTFFIYAPLTTPTSGLTGSSMQSCLSVRVQWWACATPSSASQGTSPWPTCPSCCPRRGERPSCWSTEEPTLRKQPGQLEIRLACCNSTNGEHCFFLHVPHGELQGHTCILE